MQTNSTPDPDPHYKIPAGTSIEKTGSRFLASTPQGGRVALDRELARLMQKADGRTLTEVIGTFISPVGGLAVVRAALACLAEAGLLQRVSSVNHATTTEEGRDQPATPTTGRTGQVSAIIVGFNGQQWYQHLLPSLLSQTYANLEIILVDNASTDSSAAWMEEHFPQVHVIRLAAGVSFAAAVNRGVKQASGDYLFVLNQDLILQESAVAQLVSAAEEAPGCAAVAPLLKFTWATAFLNGLGNRVGAFSWGSDNGLGHLDLGQFQAWEKLPSACFAAALIVRKAWEQVGPMDEQFLWYYEDSEWCYRARLMGFTIQAAPQAVVYHAFSGRVPDGQPLALTGEKLRNAVFGRLRFAEKLLSPGYRLRFTSQYLIEDAARFLLAGLRGDPRTMKAYLQAWRAYGRALPGLRASRAEIQKQRTLSDRELFHLQRDMPPAFIWRGVPELTWDLVQHHYLPILLSGKTRFMPEIHELSRRPRLLIISKDVVDANMGGSGVRNLEIARALSPEVDVTLACPNPTRLELPGVHLVHYTESEPEQLRGWVEENDVVLLTGDTFERFPFLQNSSARLVVDFYAPIILENLHYYLGEAFDVQESFNQPAVEITNRLARLGDFFICGSERQLDFWTGLLAANGRVNPRNFAQDRTLRSLIDVVGIGFPNRPPSHHPVVRGVHPAVPPETRIVLWGGGIWEWLDPLTLVRAWPQVVDRHPEARLVFLGTRHPNPDVPRHKIALQTEKLAEETGEKDRTIFFYEWMTYADREALLCEADIGVTLHPNHVETRYSIRTRLFDYFWSGLPVLVSGGDVTSELVEHYGLGRVTPPQDVEAVAQALIELLDQPKEAWAAAFEPVRERFAWPEVVEPLRRYCLEGSHAADRLGRAQRLAQAKRPAVGSGQMKRALYIYRQEGFRPMLHRTWRYLQWLFSRP